VWSTIMDDVVKELANIVEQSNLTGVVDDGISSDDADHAGIIEQLDSFTKSNPDVENVATEHLQHGLGRLRMV